MASYRAISTVCQAVVHLLRISAEEETDLGDELDFRVYQAADFVQPMSAGVSLFLYRVKVDGSQRIPTGRPGPDGRPRQRMLPVDVSFVLTPWAQDASLQHALLGWMMRVMEDNPILPSGLLSLVAADVFHPDETAEITHQDMSTEDLLRMWETLLPTNTYQVSVPYVARGLRLESSRPIGAGEPISQRTFDLRSITAER